MKSNFKKGLFVLTLLCIVMSVGAVNTHINKEYITSEKINDVYYVNAGDPTDFQDKVDLCEGGYCKIILPIGTLALTEPIKINKSGIIIEGRGKVSSILTIGSNQTAFILGNKEDGYISGIHLKSFKINPDSTCYNGDSQVGIFINYSKFNHISDVDINGLCGYGIKLDNSARYNKIYDNNVELKYGYAYYQEALNDLRPNNNNKVYDNRFAVDTEGTGFYFNGRGNYNQFYDNIIQGTNRTPAIFGSTGDNKWAYLNSFNDNEIQYFGVNNTYVGLLINGTIQSQVHTNLIFGNGETNMLSYCVDNPNNGADNDIKNTVCENSQNEATNADLINIYDDITIKDLEITDINLNRGNSTVAAVSFGDVNDGLYSPADNQIKLILGGVGNVIFTSEYIWINSNAKYGLLNEMATSTNPNIVPRIGDMTTGIGSVATGNLSLIADSIEYLRIGDNEVKVYKDLEIQNSARVSGFTNYVTVNSTYAITITTNLIDVVAYGSLESQLRRISFDNLDVNEGFFVNVYPHSGDYVIITSRTGGDDNLRLTTASFNMTGYDSITLKCVGTECREISRADY